MDYERYFREQLKYRSEEDNPFVYYIDMIKELNSDVSMNLKKVRLSEIEPNSLGHFIEHERQYPVFSRQIK